MDMLMRLEAGEAARDLLRRFQEVCPEWQHDVVPLEKIVAWLGYEVATFHPADHPDGTYGFVDPDEPLIWLCRDLPATLRRFTLAHELGHVVLHRQPSTPSQIRPAAPGNTTFPHDHCHIQDISEDFTGLLAQPLAEDLLGPGFVYDPHSQRELAANLFAAELLMPLARVEELYLGQHVAPDALVTLFNVSQAALLNRLASLLSGQPRATRPVQTPAERATNKPEASHTPEQPLPATTPKSYDMFQQSAIETATPALIVAGPGSGKTSTLIGRAEYLLQRQGVRPEHLLALTFSRKAAQEMQERLQRILPSDLPAPTVSTFHAFCAELLRTYGHHVGLRHNFALIDDAEGYFLLHSLADALPLHHYHNLHNPADPFQNFLKAISRAKDELIIPARYQELANEMRKQANSEEEVETAERALEVANVYALYQDALAERGDSDFGGLLMLTVQLLTEHPQIQAELEQRYQHILVDEFQDINRASGVLLRLLAGEHQRVWVVGDANQAIYGFRGASPANIANFHADYPQATVLPLSRNYRSCPDIVSLAETFRSAHLGQDVHIGSVQTVRASQPDPSITLANAPDEASELHGLVGDIQHKLAEGYNYRDIAVLCRTRAMVRKVTRALAQAGLPVHERVPLMECEHIRNVLALLSLLADASGMGLLRAARLPAHPLNQRDIEALILEARKQQESLRTVIIRGEAPLTMSDEGRQAVGRLATILKNLYHSSSSIWAVLARYLLVETPIVRDLLQQRENPQGRLMTDDYARLLQYAHAYDQRRLAQQQQAEEQARILETEPPAVPGIEEQIRDFLAYLYVLANLRQEGGNQRDEHTTGTAEVPHVLHVMTVHASKGLEFPVVYLPGLAQGRFPSRRQHNPVPPPAGMLSPESEGEQAHVSGEACLFYVATTRARDHLILSYSEHYGKTKAKYSSYVDTLMAGLPAERVRHRRWQHEQSAPSPNANLMDKQIVSSQPSLDFIEAMQPGKLRAGLIEEYQRCPRRYAYSNIYAFQNHDGHYLPFWQATSDTLQTLVERLDTADRPTSQEQVAELFASFWHEQGGDSQPFARFYEKHGQEIVTQVWQQLQEQSVNGWQLRQRLTVQLAGREIEVPIDRIEAAVQGGQPAKFVRTRFGKRKSEPKMGTRELLYLHARRQHHLGSQISLETHNLSTGIRHEIKLTPRTEQSRLDALEQALEGIERHDFTPTQDTHECAMCPFALICPA